MPAGYGDIRWNYLEECEAPGKCIAERIAELNNERLRLLRPIMKPRRRNLWVTPCLFGQRPRVGRAGREADVSTGARPHLWS